MEHIGGKTNVAEWANMVKLSCERSIENSPEKDGDFMQDGFLHCGVCKEAKREYYNFEGHRFLTSRDCKCIRDEKERIEQQKRYEERMQRIEKLRSVSLMDDVFYNATFKKFEVKDDNKEIYNACVKYSKSFQKMFEENQGLLFYGNVGTGKSFSAACIGNYVMSCFRPVVMTSFVKLLQKFSSFKCDEEELIEKLSEPDLLILDDLGAERNTDFALEKVYSIIDGRYRAKKPIILTTNLTLKEMKENTDIRYARIYDRVFEMCYPLKFDGSSRRRSEAKERFDKMKTFLEGDN